MLKVFRLVVLRLMAASIALAAAAEGTGCVSPPGLTACQRLHPRFQSLGL